MESRPPIVTILGHVDHGKSTLLDKIRNTNLVAKEVGGITQHIGAYTAQGITFIDTPGHETFGKMRSRGAQVADIAILLVAGSEGVKPQTRESLSLIKEARIPFIVAISKIDLPTSDVESTKAHLEHEGLKLEGKGGDIVVVPVSGKTGEGVEHLLEMILLVAQLHNVQADKNSTLEAVVIESGSDPRRGAFGTTVVRNGTIKVGDTIFAEKEKAKVKSIINELGKPQEELLPGFAGQILGFENTPPVGAKVTRIINVPNVSQPKAGRPLAEKAEHDKLQLVIKADTSGTLEALLNALPPGVSVISSGVGEVNQNDIMTGVAFNASIIAFGVRVSPDIEKMAQDEKVQIGKFSVIYEVTKWIEEVTKPKTSPSEEVLGRAVIIAEFPYGEKGKIAGVKVEEGRITKNDKVELLRGDEKIGSARISSIKKGPASVDKVDKGQEAGVIFSGKVDFKVGDVIESTK